MIIDGTLGATFNDGSLQAAAASPYVLKNRIINGDMVIAQRGTALISVSTDPTPRNFPVDRFFCAATGGGVYSTQQSSTAPANFNYSIINTVTTADSSIAAGDVYYMAQAIEGFNMADLAWGTANAQTVTLSFWVRSSITGTFSGSIRNSAANRAYVFTYTISAANTWEKETITIPGDTSGTWDTTNGAGAYVAWDLGSGSNFNGTANSWTAGNFLRASSAVNWISNSGATFYITGVQLEQNTSATPFERRLYNQELANCQRYYFRLSNTSSGNLYVSSICGAFNTTRAFGAFSLPVSMRSLPTAVASGARVGSPNLSTVDQAVTAFFNQLDAATNLNQLFYEVNVASGLTANTFYWIKISATGYLDASAEL
jgi:hypothetical protein